MEQNTLLEGAHMMAFVTHNDIQLLVKLMNENLSAEQIKNIMLKHRPLGNCNINSIEDWANHLRGHYLIKVLFAVLHVIDDNLSEKK